MINIDYVLLKITVFLVLIIINKKNDVTCAIFYKNRFHLPKIPDILKPPVPSQTNGFSSELKVDENVPVDPEVTPGLFQGDMAMSDDFYNQWRVGVRWDIFPEKKWKNRTIPYVISPLYEAIDYVTIYKAIITLNYMTCVKFVPWNGKAKDYLLIWPIKYPKGCWSFVGKHGGPQIVSLQSSDDNSPNCLGNEGRAIHELLHAMGIFHEQSRSDRDKFVKIHEENIIPKYLSNFDKQSLENTTYSFEYDYNSIMHYGSTFFSKSKDKPSITPRIRGVKLGQRQGLSKTDCLKINELYGCLKTPNRSRKYYNLCNYLGL